MSGLATRAEKRHQVGSLEPSRKGFAVRRCMRREQLEIAGIGRQRVARKPALNCEIVEKGGDTFRRRTGGGCDFFRQGNQACTLLMPSVESEPFVLGVVLRLKLTQVSDLLKIHLGKYQPADTRADNPRVTPRTTSQTG